MHKCHCDKYDTVANMQHTPLAVGVATAGGPDGPDGPDPGLAESAEVADQTDQM